MKMAMKNMSDTLSIRAYQFARKHPHLRHLVRGLVRDSKWVFLWTCLFPEDCASMARRVTHPSWVRRWNIVFADGGEGQK